MLLHMAVQLKREEAEKVEDGGVSYMRESLEGALRAGRGLHACGGTVWGEGHRERDDGSDYLGGADSDQLCR